MTTVGKLILHAGLAAALLGIALPAAVSASPAGPAACTARSAQATLVGMIPASTPPLATLAGLTGTARVRFELDPNGIPHDAAVVRSSGWAILDAAARKAALEQNYSAEVRDCAPVAGTYAVDVEYVP